MLNVEKNFKFKLTEKSCHLLKWGFVEGIRQVVLFAVMCFEWALKLAFTAWKVSKYAVFSGPYFPVFALNTEIYSVNLRIQSEYKKIRARKKLPIWTLFKQWLKQHCLVFSEIITGNLRDVFKWKYFNYNSCK